VTNLVGAGLRGMWLFGDTRIRPESLVEKSVPLLAETLEEEKATDAAPTELAEMAIDAEAEEDGVKAG
jgi:hypothetical protein